jgi:hypothetical protein
MQKQNRVKGQNSPGGLDLKTPCIPQIPWHMPAVSSGSSAQIRNSISIEKSGIRQKNEGEAKSLAQWPQ